MKSRYRTLVLIQSALVAAVILGWVATAGWSSMGATVRCLAVGGMLAGQIALTVLLSDRRRLRDPVVETVNLTSAETWASIGGSAPVPRPTKNIVLTEEGPAR